MGNEKLSEMMKFLAYVLEPDEYEQAKDLATAAFADVGIAVDRCKSAADSRYVGASSMQIDVKVPTRQVVRGVQRYEAARAEVAPYVGDVGYACDSADSVYEHALKQLGHDVSGLVGHPNAARVVFQALQGKRAKPRALAADAKAMSRRNEMFPNGNRLVSEFS